MDAQIDPIKKTAMYSPKQFSETDLTVLHALIAAHPLGAWVTRAADDLNANHIPFMLDSTRGKFGTLVAHVARANDVWTAPCATQESLVIFQGSEAYISPSSYPSKQIDGKVVPTWNYAVVHAYGTPRAINDPHWLLQHLADMTGTHEAGKTLPWKLSDAPSDFIDNLLKAIVGIEIPITRISGKWKVSQNRTLPDQLGVMAALMAAGSERSAEMAALVARHGSVAKALLPAGLKK